METILNIKGMHCKSCEMLIQDALEEKGVKSQIDHKAGKAKVVFDPKKTSLNEIKAIIKEQGYEVM